MQVFRVLEQAYYLALLLVFVYNLGMKEIWVTGDMHGDISRLSVESFPDGKNMDKSDVIEILGDFGLVWEQEESKYEKWWLDWLNDKPFTTVVTLGNHENYDRIKKLPAVKMFGAPVWKLRDSVFILQSGYVYNINDTKIWNFNGGQSHDIDDGIIDSNDPDWKTKVFMMKASGRERFRIKGINWWKEEIEQDSRIYKRGLKELAKVNNEVDFIWTHCTNTETAKLIGFYETDRLCKYLDEIRNIAIFKAWYFGHYHIDKTVEPGHVCLYTKIERIA